MTVAHCIQESRDRSARVSERSADNERGLILRVQRRDRATTGNSAAHCTRIALERRSRDVRVQLYRRVVATPSFVTGSANSIHLTSKDAREKGIADSEARAKRIRSRSERVRAIRSLARVRRISTRFVHRHGTIHGIIESPWVLPISTYPAILASLLFPRSSSCPTLLHNRTADGSSPTGSPCRTRRPNGQKRDCFDVSHARTVVIHCYILPYW